KDPYRVRRSIGRIGDSCNSGKPAYPELLETLVPLLKSEDSGTGRAAADALRTYAGEEVVKNLIPLLGDQQNIIVTEASRNLLRQRDKAMLRRLLGEAAKINQSAVVRMQAAQLLKKLPEDKKK
ncbi:MAG: HEAT repeat domain-containing protein, partial [Planctomycetia bacterium]|nr:HEAT repeat domain-containing protein [Planctomycetia bacterium]